MSVGWTHWLEWLLYMVLNSAASAVRRAEASPGLRVVIRDKQEGRKDSDVMKT